MKKNSLWGIAAVILALLALILFPSSPDLDSYTHLYEQGLYTDVCEGLAREVDRNPDWCEGRELLVKAALPLGRLDLALEQMEALKAAGWETPPLELRLTNWLKENTPDPDYAAATVEAAGGNAEGTIVWDWGIEFYLQLLIKQERVEDIPEALALFAAKHSPVETYKPQLYFLVTEAWDLMVTGIEGQALWETSILLEEKMPGQSWRQMAMWKIAETGGLTALQAQYPQDTFLAVVRAQMAPPQEGLAFLRSWERKNTLAPEEELFYSSAKSQVISQAEALTPEDLNWIKPDQLFEAAINRTFLADTRYILDRLEEEGDYAQEVELIRSALDGPKPYLTLSGYYPVVSPDGRWAMAKRDLDWRLYNLRSGAEVTKIANPDSMLTWVWSPDSSKLAGADWQGHGAITIYDTLGGSFQLGVDTENYIPVGWYNDKILWIQPVRSSRNNYTWRGQPLLCNVESGEVFAHQDMEKSEIEFSPGPNDSMVWRQVGSGPSIMLGGKVNQSDLRSLEILGWLRDGSGAVAASSTRLYLWKDEEPQPLGLTGYFLGWRNDTEFYWLEPIVAGRFLVSPIYQLFNSYSLSLGSVPTRLMTYNLRTGKTEDMNVVGRIAAAAGKTVLLNQYGELRVINLP